MSLYAKGSWGRAVTILAVAGMLGCAYADRIVPFNGSWKFYRGNVSGAQAPSYSDALWQTACLPHADSILLNTNASSYYIGYCWYRKTFTPDASMQGKKLFLEIEAAMQTASIYVNGDSLTTHPGGYTPIILDITPYVNFTGSNVIAARLNNNYSTAFPPGNSSDSIDFLYFGGLYRNVYLHVADSLHITNPILANIPAGGGIFVTNSPVASGAATASVYVKTNVLNEYKSTQSCKVVTTILNGAGQTVVIKADSTGLAAGGSNTFADTLTVASPQLWTPNTPNLYLVVSQIYDNGRLTDTCTTTIGIRTISFSYANGLQINGQRFILRGANRHQEFPYIGNALPNSGQYRDALRMKQYGFNFVRTCHYAQSPSFFNACDRLGIGAIACLPGWYYFYNTTAFINNSLSAQRDMVRYYRNHPSILLWESMMNESTPTVAYLDSAQALAHREFPGNQMYTCGQESNGILDVYISSEQDGIRSYSGSRPGVISEYGDWSEGCSSSGTPPIIKGCQDRVTRSAGESALLLQAMNHATGLSKNRGLSWLTADGVWSMFDYQSWPRDCLTTSGSLDLFRIPKYSGYFFRSQRSPADTAVSVSLGGPMVFIASQWSASSNDTIRVFSNCDSISLYLNNNLVATQAPITGTNLEHPYFKFLVKPFNAGTLRADGKMKGMSGVAATYSVSTPGSAKSIVMTIDTAGLQFQADGSDIAIVYASILDSNGTVVPTASNSVYFAITGGPGNLIGINPMPAQAGIATILLQAGTVGGITTVSTASSGLTGASATVGSIAPPATGTVAPFRRAVVGTKQGFSIRRINDVLLIYSPLEMAGADAVKFTMYNASGRLVGTWNLAGGITKVKMTSMSRGLYVGQITSAAGKYLQKVLW